MITKKMSVLENYISKQVRKQLNEGKEEVLRMEINDKIYNLSETMLDKIRDLKRYNKDLKDDNLTKLIKKIEILFDELEETRF